MDEPGTGTDLIWFTTQLTVPSEDPFSLDADGDNKADETEYAALVGGNIVVPHTQSSIDSGDGVEGDKGDVKTPPGLDKKK